MLTTNEYQVSRHIQYAFRICSTVGLISEIDFRFYAVACDSRLFIHQCYVLFGGRKSLKKATPTAHELYSREHFQVSCPQPLILRRNLIVLRWLDVTPTSRVIARCTSDTGEVDNPLPSTLYMMSDVSSRFIMHLAAIAFFTPQFIVPGIFVALVGGWLSQICLTAQRSVKREMNNAVAPVLGQWVINVFPLHAFKPLPPVSAQLSLDWVIN